MADSLDEMCQMINCSRQGLCRLDLQPHHAALTTLIAAHNCITKLDILQICPFLQQLSLAHNRLVDMRGLSHLKQLTVLNLAGNSISAVEVFDCCNFKPRFSIARYMHMVMAASLESLPLLSWIDLSCNNISDMAGLSCCINLRHLDLSENNISDLSDISSLTALNTLLLHGNTLTTLATAPYCLPVSLHTLSLEANCIEDLTQVINLYFLTQLQQLSLANNPCVQVTADNEGFDYRPYILCYCPSIQVLDGYELTESERQMAYWLYQQGHIHGILPSQHVLLVRYLTSVCPLSSAQQLQREQGSCLPWRQQSHYLPASHPESHYPYTTTAYSHTGNSRDSSLLTNGTCHREEQHALISHDLSNDDVDACSSTSLLESDSVYLPVEDVSPSAASHQRFAAVRSADSSTSEQFHHTLQPWNAGFSAPCPATSRQQTISESAYERRERRLIHPYNPSAQAKHRTKFSVTSRPQTSHAEPVTHKPRLSYPSTAYSQDYDMSLETSQPSPFPKPSKSASSVSASNFSLIHRVVDSKQRAREQEQAMKHVPSPSPAVLSPQSSQVVVPGQQQQQTKGIRSRVKGLDSNRQAELSKLVKCQQNAERMNQHRDRTAPGLLMSTDSGSSLSRSTSDTLLAEYGREAQPAATLIQAVWRGYWAREHNLNVVSIRNEIRARRAEDHIALLRADLDRHKKLYNEEKRLRTLQMEAIRYLYHEVQQLKFSVSSSRPGTADSMQSSASTRPPSTGSGLTELQHIAESGPMCHCQSLKSQVWELQQKIECMSIRTSRRSSIDCSSSLSSIAQAGTSDSLSTVKVLEYSDGQSYMAEGQIQPAACQWSSIPHSLSPYPSEEEEMYFRQTPNDGAPTPPRGLSLQHRGERSVLLQWLPSSVHLYTALDGRPTITGYNVYINDHRQGVVSNKKTAAVITGLLPSATYKFYIKALSSDGESFESNIVVARLARGSERQRLSESSDSDVLPDSDKDCDSSDIRDKPSRLRKKENRKHRKVRSPRSERKVPKAGLELSQGEEKIRNTGSGDREESTQQQQPCQQETSVGILMQPKLHKHRRSRSKEQNDLSPLHSDSPSSTPGKQEESRPPARVVSTASQELSQALLLTQSDIVYRRRAGSPARDLSFKEKSDDHCSPGSQDGDRRKSATPPVQEIAQEAHVVLSETFTVDIAKSFLHNLNLPANRGLAEDHPASSFMKGHQRKGSKDLKVENSVPASHKFRSSPNRGASGSHPVLDASEEVGQVHTHHRTGSKEHNTPFPRDTSGKEEEDGGGRERERCSTPVIDGRRRASSRPSSPMIFEGPMIVAEQRDADPISTEVPRRMTTAENLAQRFRKSPSPGSPCGGREADEGEKKSPQHGSRSRKQSASPDSLPDSLDLDDSSRSLSLRQRTHSVESEGELKEVSVPLILSKLHQMTRNPESAIRENRLRKLSSEDEERKRSSRHSRHISESDNDMSSDPGSHLPPRAPPASDSSSGSHSDDNKARSHHRRRSPDQRLPATSGYNSDQVTGRPSHSPIIMEGGSKKGSSSVRRNASFHELLPSRPHDSQPSLASEESQGNPRCSIRSRSPSPSRNRQPVLSGAQLKRQTPEVKPTS